MSPDELFAEYERLKALAERLQAENAALQEQMRAQKEEYEQRLAEAQAQIEELRKQLFGSKADRLTPEQEEQLKQLNQDLEDEAERPAPLSDQILENEDRAVRRRRQRQQRKRRPLPEHLETETITLEPEVTHCPCCGKPLQKIGEEVSEEIDLIPAKLIRRRTVRPKYACPCGEAGVNIAPMPPRLIPQSRLGLGLGVHIVLSRFDDHLSYYRLEQQFRERHGILIPRQQMVQWVEPIAELLRPVYDRMWQYMLAGGYLQVDETPVRVMDPDVKGKAARGYLWFYAVPGGDVILDFHRSRGLLPVQQRLKGFVGTIQTDAYEVYQSLEGKESHIDRIGCLAHARRRFYAALKENLADSVWFINQIRLLYKIEDHVRELDATERQMFPQQNAPSLWDALRSKAEELKPRFLPRSTMGKAISYFLNEYEALTGYLRDPRYQTDNNLVENSIRPTAVGRRRWLFIGHPDAGWRSAVLYSILASCRRRGIDPEDYLTDVLRRLPQQKINQIEELLPENWKPPPSAAA
ncbi:MAG: IS66 family transposase [Acidobacteria bacterium]|nr:IS66 family transposase [Acidobacteriota bacterium]